MTAITVWKMRLNCAVIAAILVVFALHHVASQSPLAPNERDVMVELFESIQVFPYLWNTSTDPCTWSPTAKIVQCDGESPFQHVVDISIGRLASGGVLPESLITLQSLNCFYCYFCNLYGELPLFLINGSMPALQYLVVNGNALTSDVGRWGSISPPWYCELSNNLLFGDISNIKCTPYYSMQLDGNSFHGSFPWYCANGTALVIADTLLSSFGTRPLDAVFSLQQLAFDDAEVNDTLDEFNDFFAGFQLFTGQGNYLHGSIPAGIYSAHPNQSMTLELILSNNMLSGSLPWPDLQAPIRVFDTLDLSYNQLTGELEPLAYVPMQVLNAMYNQLSGSIPPAFANSSLVELILRSNKLTGYFNHWPALCQVIDVSHNFLIGCPLDLNIEYQYYTGLEVLVLNNNLFVCDETVEVSFTLSPLTWFDLSDTTMVNFGVTNFSRLFVGCPITVLIAANIGMKGTLEGWNLTPLTEISYLDLSHNQLSGSVPPIQVLPPFLISLHMTNNNLSGEIVVGTVGASPLLTLDLRGNPALRMAPGTPVAPSATLMDARDGYTCPGLRVIDAALQLYIDPAVYDFEFCQCNSFFYGAPADASVSCQPLSQICANLVCINTVATNASTIVMANGYVPLPTSNAATTAVACPVNTQRVTYACTGACVCAGAAAGLNCSCDNVCSTGYESLFCSKCQEGYYALNYMCLQCRAEGSSRDDSALIAGAVVVVTTLLLAASVVPTPRSPAPSGATCCLSILVELWALRLAILLVIIDGVALTMCVLFLQLWQMAFVGTAVLFSLLALWAWRKSETPGESGKFTDASMMTILITYLQTLAAILPPGVFALEGRSLTITAASSPPSLGVYGPSASRSAANFALFGMECLVSGANPIVVSFLAYCLLPIVAGLVMLAVYGAARFKLHLQRRSFAADLDYREAKDVLARRSTGTVVFLFNFFVFNVFLAVVQLLNCGSHGRGAYLVVQPWMNCYDTQWWMIFGVGLGFLATYGAVIASIGRHLHLIRKNHGHEEVVDRFAFLVRPFRKERWWYQAAILLRRFVIALGLAAFPSNSSLGPLLVVMALMIALLAQASTWPFAHGMANWLEASNLILLAATYVIVILLGVGDDLYGDGLRVVILVINSLYIVVAVLVSTSPAFRHCCARVQTGMATPAPVIINSERTSLLQDWVDGASQDYATGRGNQERTEVLESENASLRNRLLLLERENHQLRNRQGLQSS